MDVPPDVSNKILALNITLTKKLSKSQKKKKKKKKNNFFNRKSNENYLSIRVRSYKILNQSHQCHLHWVRIHLLN